MSASPSAGLFGSPVPLFIFMESNDGKNAIGTYRRRNIG
jgi:hypothetical protein